MDNFHVSAVESLNCWKLHTTNIYSGFIKTDYFDFRVTMILGVLYYVHPDSTQSYSDIAGTLCEHLHVHKVMCTHVHPYVYV